MMDDDRCPRQSAASAEVSLVDWDGALARVGGSKDALRELVQIFCQDECPRLTCCIRDALEKESGADLARAAHTLKSSADLFGAKRAFDAARTLEEFANRSDFHGAAYSWTTLERELANLQAALEKFKTERDRNA